jgi:hypothetical protein
MIELAKTGSLLSALMVLVSSSQFQSRNDTLSRWYETENNYITSSSNSLYQLLNSASRECVEEKMKLSELGNNTYDDDYYIPILITKAFELCVDNQDELWRIRADEYMQVLRYGWYNEEESIECLKKKIQETEPYATIIMGDGEDQKNDEEEPCNVEPHVEWSHDLFNEKASPFPCFVRSRNEVKFDNIFFKLRIIEFGGLSEERKKNEMENIGRLLRRMAEMNYRCLIRHIE